MHHGKGYQMLILEIIKWTARFGRVIKSTEGKNKQQYSKERL